MYFTLIKANNICTSLIIYISFVNISYEGINIILHCRKSILYHGGDVWVKKASKDGFDVPQGYYDGAEVSELMGLFVLSKIKKSVHTDNHGLYRDDGLIVPGNRKANDNISKLLFKFSTASNSALQLK